MFYLKENKREIFEFDKIIQQRFLLLEEKKTPKNQPWICGKS